MISGLYDKKDNEHERRQSYLLIPEKTIQII
jgi:hypothetical protein